MSVEMLERAIGNAHKVLANVTPDQYDLPTPCVSWTVRDLINHMVGGAHWFAASVEAGESPQTDEEQDFTAGDVLAAYTEGTQKAVAAFSAEGAMEKVIKLPFGEFPGAIFVHLATTDHAQHAWDLAKATGQSTDIDADFAAQLLAANEPMLPDSFRGDDGAAPFGPKQDAPESASAADRLAAFLGRIV